MWKKIRKVKVHEKLEDKFSFFDKDVLITHTLCYYQLRKFNLLSYIIYMKIHISIYLAKYLELIKCIAQK